MLIFLEQKQRRQPFEKEAGGAGAPSSVSRFGAFWGILGATLFSIPLIGCTAEKFVEAVSNKEEVQLLKKLTNQGFKQSVP